MILVPVPSPTSQPVGCVWVKDAIQVCGVRLMPARQNTGQLGTILIRMHSMTCVAYLAAILISALLMPTLLAASTTCNELNAATLADDCPPDEPSERSGLLQC